MVWFEADIHTLGGAAPLVVRNPQEAAVHRLRDGLLATASQALRAVLCLEQLLKPFFAQGASDATDLRPVAGQTMLVVIHADEKLRRHVFAPTRADLWVICVR